MPRTVILLLLGLSLSIAACTSNPAGNTNATPTPTTSPDIKDTDGFTPLMNAAKNGDLDGGQRAIASGANVNATNETGISALYIAAGLGHKELTKLLIEKGANVNAKTSGGFTPLMQAALTGQVEIAQMLLDAGADATVTDIANKNAVDYAPPDRKKEFSEILKVGAANPPPLKVVNEKGPSTPAKKK